MNEYEQYKRTTNLTTTPPYQNPNSDPSLPSTFPIFLLSPSDPTSPEPPTSVDLYEVVVVEAMSMISYGDSKRHQ